MMLMFLSLIFSLAFIVFSLLVRRGLFLSIDQYIDQTLPFVLTSPVYFISKALAFVYVPLSTVVAALFIKFLIKKQNKEAAVSVMSFSGAILAEFILKPLFNISCPQSYYSKFLANQEVFGLLQALQSIGFFETCYPSSHTASYVIFCGYLAYLVSRYIKKKRKRFILLATLSTIIILVGPSRLYLHAHWFSDVIGGYLLGFALLFAIISLYRKLIR